MKKIVGIIAEYNPFHNGHKHQIMYAKDKLEADYCVVVMSGNFVQRGAPAIVDKCTRAQMAISEGADLVLEIPACYATGALDDFSLGAVALLESLGVVTHLVFGSELGDLQPVSLVSNAMMSDGNSFQVIRSSMKSELSSLMARGTSLSAIKDEQLFASCIDIVNKPNSMLGILYLNALSRLDSDIIPVTHTRIGQAYLDDSQDNMLRSNHFASASAVRKHLLEGLPIDNYIPRNAYRLLVDELKQHRPLLDKDCWDYLYNVLSGMTEELTDYRLVSDRIADRITESWKKCDSWDELISNVSSSEIAPARVNRCLIHIMLGITEKIMHSFLEHEICYYAKVLSISESGKPLLELVSNNSKVPVLQGRRMENLSQRARTQLHIDQIADSIYKKLQTNI